MFMPRKKGYRKKKRFFRKGLAGTYCVERQEDGTEWIVYRKHPGRGDPGEREPAYEPIRSPAEKARITGIALRDPRRRKEMLEEGEIWV
jgi:hypothetical protein